MINIDELVSYFIVLWAVVDPIGTVPVFLAITKNYEEAERKKIALYASFVAFTILTFFLVVGELLLKHIGVPLAAFQTSGGIILFLFALNMIFGDSKPEEEIQLIKSGKETAIFPLAIPSIASPGAILAVVLLADSSRSSLTTVLSVFAMVTLVLIANYGLMRSSGFINRKIGNPGAIVISKVMGLILAAMAATNVLMGIKEFFKIQ